MKKFYAFAAAAVMALGAYAQDGAPLYITGETGVSAEEGGLVEKWNPALPGEFEYVDGEYTITLNALSMFKISTAMGDWDTFNGAALTCDYGDQQGVAVALDLGDSNINCPWPGDWTVKVAGDLSTITLTTTTPAPNGIELYLRGDMNSWGAEADWMFEQLDDKIFKFVCAEGQEIVASQAFKVADSGWSKYNFGADEAEPFAILDYENQLFAGSNSNLTLEEAWNGVAFFNLAEVQLYLSNDKDAECPWEIEGGESVNTISVENGAAQYFNLQGVRVANPEKGLYIVVKNGKASKVVR